MGSTLQSSTSDSVADDNPPGEAPRMGKSSNRMRRLAFFTGGLDGPGRFIVGDCIPACLRMVAGEGIGLNNGSLGGVGNLRNRSS